MQPVLTYNQELAAKAGGGDYVSQGGSYICTIKEAKYVTAGTGSKGVQFSVETNEGQKANYLNLYYAKAPVTQGQAGEPITGGMSALNAIMGVAEVRQMTAVQRGQEWFCPDLEGKVVGLFLQKKLTSKQDGSDSYGFEIKVPFCPKTRRTMREIIDNKPAQTVDRMASQYKDIDERKHTGSSANGFDSGDTGSQYPDGW